MTVCWVQKTTTSNFNFQTKHHIDSSGLQRQTKIPHMISLPINIQISGKTFDKINLPLDPFLAAKPARWMEHTGRGSWLGCWLFVPMRIDTCHTHHTRAPESQKHATPTHLLQWVTSNCKDIPHSHLHYTAPLHVYSTYTMRVPTRSIARQQETYENVMAVNSYAALIQHKKGKASDSH